MFCNVLKSMAEIKPNIPTLSERSPILFSKIRENNTSVEIAESYQGCDTENQNQNDSDSESSYSNFVSRKWTNWSKATQAVICVLGMSLSIIVITLLVCLGSSGTTSPSASSNGNGNNLKQAANSENDNENYYGPLLEIPQGKLRWNVLQSRDGRDYYVFYKIPYAQKPLQDLRFEPPQPAEAWEGILHEKEVAPQCIQKSKYSPIIEAVGEEDCLYLNLYTPKLPSQDSPELMPVMFYIHGGGFSDGNGSRYGAKYFMDEDAILITFQYRLGPFGFLSSETGDVKGNNGMKDQIQALKWVNQNIKYFGGDPHKINIFGNSAGAMSVSQIMLSPMANGLYNSAITQSGAAICGSTLNMKEAQEKSFESFAREAGCWSTRGNVKRRNRSILKCLREKDAATLAVIRKPDIIYTQTIESYEAEDEEQEANKFFPDSPYNLLKSGRVNKVPWMVGVNSVEFIFVAAMDLKDPELVEQMNNNWTAVAPTLGDHPYFGPSAEKISTAAKEFYFGEKPINNDTLINLTNLISDRDFVHCSKVQARMQSAYSDVFLYYMSKRPAKSYSDKALTGYPPADYGAAHADELQYLFNYYGYPEYLKGSEYYAFSKFLVQLWVQFATTGKPQQENIPEWQKIQAGQNPISWMELNDNPHPTTVLQSRMEFWDQFTPEELCYV